MGSSKVDSVGDRYTPVIWTVSMRPDPTPTQPTQSNTQTETIRSTLEVSDCVGGRYPTMVKTLHEVKTGSKFRLRARSKGYDDLCQVNFWIVAEELHASGKP